MLCYLSVRQRKPYVSKTENAVKINNTQVTLIAICSCRQVGTRCMVFKLSSSRVLLRSYRTSPAHNSLAETRNSFIGEEIFSCVCPTASLTLKQLDPPGKSDGKLLISNMLCSYRSGLQKLLHRLHKKLWNNFSYKN